MHQTICRRIGECRPVAAMLLAASIASVQPARAAETVCSDAPLVTLSSVPGTIPSPCTPAAGTLLLESSYYQNASEVGGTALAAYPLLRIRAGVAPHLEIALDAPSQIAESGPGGSGLYPVTHAGYGITYGFAGGPRSAFAAGFEIVPPASLYGANASQPKYRLDLTSGYRLTSAVMLTSNIAAATSHSAGFGVILPAVTVGANIAGDRATMFSADVGTRLVTRRAAGQSFGDIAVSRALERRVAVRVALGTAFNPVADAKAHYLSAGLIVRP